MERADEAYWAVLANDADANLANSLVEGEVPPNIWTVT